MDLTYTSPIQIHFNPISGSNITFELKLKGSKHRIKVNIDINIFYKDPYNIGKVFLANSGLQSVYTTPTDNTYTLKFKVPDFKNYTQSHISLIMEPLGDPYQKVIVEDAKVIDTSIPQPIIETHQSAIVVPHTEPSIATHISTPIDMVGAKTKPAIVPQTPISQAHPKILPSPIQTIITTPKSIQHTQPINLKKIIEESKTEYSPIFEPKIAIASIVRDEEENGNLIRFLDCCNDLENYHRNIIYIFIEGDSTDKTYDILKSWVERRNGSVLVKLDRGYSPFPNDRDNKRTVYFAGLRNMLINLILSLPLVTEILATDANYGWKGDIIGSLREVGADIAAPLVVSHKDDLGRYIFYDIWAFRKNGREFSPSYPYIDGMVFDQPVDIDSAGGCYLIKRNVLDAGAKYDGNNDCEHVGFCRNVKSMGFKIKIDPRICVIKGGQKEL